MASRVYEFASWQLVRSAEGVLVLIDPDRQERSLGAHPRALRVLEVLCSGGKRFWSMSELLDAAHINGHPEHISFLLSMIRRHIEDIPRNNGLLIVCERHKGYWFTSEVGIREFAN